ncbi:glycerol-3-phosphate dehydrogenase/oxidase [bacterium]|nr:glycerol-3-phosphate dehydrogenase/oxidase [bacterium]RQV95727.1 MAG: glycerol-3-phosphate dehydrogenase/oxidase [bacterium]
MNREEMLKTITEPKQKWDFIVIGGGATGVGTALEAASRGYRVALIEQNDFSAGTSSRSTKLIHGGVRYLQQGNISLVLEALKERGLLRRNAPHLVRNLPFIVPTYDWWEGPFYGIGLKLYDVLAGKEGFGASKNLSTEETLKQIPTVEMDGLRGGVIYHDGQFDDSRLVINLAQTAAEQGATVINYAKAVQLQKKHDCISGVIVQDVENNKEYTLESRAVINATGVFSDQIRQMDDPEAPPIIQPSQGVHIVLDRSFLPGETAIMVPHTDDGRVLFAIPWHDKVIVGTTDTPVDQVVLEPIPLKEEIEFLLTHAAKYLIKDPSPEDVLSTFAGLRPLVSGTKNLETATISREHTISISRSGLVTIAGGKWTTYRKMAEETLDHAIAVAQLEHRPSVSRTLQIHGYHNHADSFGTLSDYGSDAIEIQNMIKKDPTLGERLPKSDILKAEVIWAVRHEMARTVEDFCARRRRLLFLDARASIKVALTVAQLMAAELKKGKDWEKDQVEGYQKTAQRYFIH